MSVLVQEKSTGRYYAYVKGAESQIMERLTPESAQSGLKDKISEEVFRFGGKGLRTLVFAMRELSQEEFNAVDWSSADAQTLSDAVEANLTVIACTGVEDELQEDVAECIQDFRDAGIKFWMLTGDLGHTALEIGYNCGVLSRDESTNALYKIEESSEKEVTEKVRELKPKVAQSRKEGKTVSILVSGRAFAVAQGLNEEVLNIFQRDLLLQADSVILYRSSPKQKAVAVNMVKTLYNDKKLTLSIGDGFNDVNMIQSAHIGIGVQGKESNQAAAFADYAIVKFKDLRRILFWHGRNYGHKTIFFVLLNLYKNWWREWVVVIMNTQMAMSAVSDIYGLFFALFNVNLCTYLIVWWVTDSKDVDQSVQEKNLPFKMSDLYAYCRKDFGNYHKFYAMMVLSIPIPVACTYGCFVDSELHGAMDAEGRQFGFLMIGITLTFVVVVFHYLCLMMMQHQFDLPWVAWFIFSTCWLWILAALADSNKISFYYKSLYSEVMTNWTFWLIVVLGIAIAFIPVYAFTKYRQLFGGDPRHDIAYRLRYQGRSNNSSQDRPFKVHNSVTQETEKEEEASPNTAAKMSDRDMLKMN